MVNLVPLWKIGTRDQAKEILVTSRERTKALISDLSDSQLKSRTQLGGGAWSIKDLLGHLAGYEEQATAIALGKKPRFDFSKFASVDERNAADIERKRDWSVKQVRQDLTNMRTALLDAIDGMDDERWLTKIETRNGRSALALVLGNLLVGGHYGLFAHDLAHITDLKKSVKALTAEPK